MNSEIASMSENKEIIKDSILKKSKAFFMKAGVRSPSMDDIARQLSISKKTLYQHFTSKHDLVAQIFNCEEREEDARMKKIHATAKNAIEETILLSQFVMEDLKQLMLSLPTFYEIKKYYSEVWTESETRMFEQVYQGVFQNIERGKREGLYRSEINSDIIAKIHVQTAKSIIISDNFPSEKYYKPKLYREYMLYHLNGIATTKGLKTIEENLRSYEL